MSETIPRTVSGIHFDQLADMDGYLVLLPAARVSALLARGVTSITSTISLIPDKPPREWITLAEAARRHVDDVDGLDVECARYRIARAIKAGKIDAKGEGTHRRIEPDNFDAWCLAQRKKNLVDDPELADPEIIE